MAIRELERTIESVPTSDGAGVKLRRSLGSVRGLYLDPFLMLDEFSSDDAADYIAGFPSHPHRGFETVTYMLEGRMRHRDNKGNEGVLETGGVQWMTAGRGIVHSEMPEQRAGRMRGFQLWVNLPAAQKMTAPRYQEFAADRFELAMPSPGMSAKVIAGRFGGAAGPVTGIAIDPLYIDLRLGPGVAQEVPVTRGHAAVIYVFDGAASCGATAVPRGTLAVLGDGARIRIAAGKEGAGLLLIAGRPLGEPIARYGPFVMNTRDEIAQAFADFHAGRL